MRTLVLFVVLLCSSSSEAAPVEAEVRAVWYAQWGDEHIGGTSPIVVRVSENKRGRPSVGVVEEYLGGAGDMWRAAAWLAAFNASQATGTALSDHEFIVASLGHIDGPSAGMLVTATMIALLRGVPVRADTTMTGTVNPDGSAGPVGGVPQKMRGAAKQGIKRFGFPIGTRMSVDLSTGKPVDLVQLGKQLGMEAIEVRDMWQAFEVLTGKKLPPPDAVPDAAMTMTDGQRKLVQQRYAEWSAYIGKGWQRLKVTREKLPPPLRSSSDELVGEAAKLVKSSQAHAAAGRLVAAHEDLMLASVTLRMVSLSTQLAKSALAQDGATLERRVVEERDATLADLDKLVAEARQREPGESVDGAVNAAAALQDAARALAFYEIASGHLADAVAKVDGELELTSLGQGLMMLAAARGKIAIARERLALYPVVAGAKAPSPELLARHARVYGSAGNAALRYFEVISIDTEAASRGVRAEVLHDSVAAGFMEYRLARITSAIARQSGQYVSDPVVARVLELAAGAETYIESAGLVNKGYSLGGTVGEDGRWRVRAQDTLDHQLKLARARAKQVAAEAVSAVGNVPAAARWYFELADARARGDDEDRLMALDHYWSAALYSSLAVSLAR